MANYKVTDTELASIANAIRIKGGTSAQLEFPEEFVSAIEDISSSGGIGSYVRGTLVGEYDNRTPSAGGVGGAWTSTGYDTSDDIGYIVDYYYNDNLIKSALILKDKLLPNAAPNHAFETLGIELAANGGLYAPAGFNVKIENSIMIVSFSAVGSKDYSAKVYTAVHSGGGSVTPSLPYSDQSKILASSYPGNYSDDNPTWGGLEVIKSNIGLIKNSDFIYLRDNSFAKIDLGEPNHSFVAYFVGLVLSGNQWPVAIGTLYENSLNNSIALCSNSERICYTHFGNTIAQTSFSSIKTFVGALRIDGTNKLSSCFVNGEQIAQPSSFNNSGQYCSFGAFSNSTYFANLFIKYLAVVDGTENDSTIISNQQHLMNLYTIE